MPPVADLTNPLRADGEARARLIYPWELPSIMRKHIYTGAMGSVYFVLFSGMYLVTLGNSIGLRYWQWGLLSAGSSFALVLQLASASLVSRTGNRKAVWYASALAGRMLRACAVATAFALSSSAPAAARAFFIILLVLSNCANSFADPPWFSWLVDIIPEHEHGHFWGRRSAWIALANMCVLVPVGYGIDRVDEDFKIPAIMGLFAFAFVVGIVDLIIHRTIPEPPMAMPPRRRFWKEVAAPFADTRFRPWLAFNACWTFGMTLGGSLATVYFVEDLGIKRNFLGGSIVLIMLPLLGTALAGRRIGGLVDRYGVKRTLRWGHRFWAILPAFWLFATPSNALWCLGTSALIGGLASMAAFTAANKLITRLPPVGHVPMYVAVSACVGSIAGGLGPLVGGLILQMLEGRSWTMGTHVIVGFHLLFVLSFLLRNASTVLIRKVIEPQTPRATESGLNA